MGLSAVAPTADASSITVKALINIGQYYDYQTAKYVAISPVTGIVSYTFNTDQRSVDDYGLTTITTFGGFMGATWSSPLTSLISSDPYSGAYGPFSASYTFPNVSDYSSTFIEDAAAQANTYVTNGTDNSNYHIELRATRRSPPRNGDGTSDYAFDRSTLLDYYRSFVASGEAVYFNESYGDYRFVAGVPVYSDGKSWADYQARLIEVVDNVTEVPEPTTAVLIIPGLLLCLRRTRKSNFRHV